MDLLYSVYGPKTCICIRFCLPFFCLYMGKYH